MEFNNFNIFFSENSAVNEIKRLLISRDSSNKIIAVKSILNSIKSSSNPVATIEGFINADIIELLCEASCTRDLHLLELIFKCISELLESKKFFTQHHATFTFEYTLRTLHVLLEIDGKATFISGLELICILMQRLKQFKIPLNDVCKVSSIINLINSVFANTPCPELICVSAEVIINALQSMDVKPFKKLMVDCTSQALQFLIETLENDQNKKIIIITAELVNNSMRFLVQKDGSVTQNELVGNLLLKLYLTYKEVLVPVLLDTNICTNDLQLLSVVLNGLLSVYYSPEEKLMREYSEFLVYRGMLKFLPQLENPSGDSKLNLIIRSIMYEILVCLSQHNLGQERWKVHLSPGLEMMPLGSSYTSIFLYEFDVIIPLASIVYNYFYLISFLSPVVDVGFLQNICRFILTLNEKPPSPILKALWFLFTVAYLCCGEDYPQSKAPMMRIIQYLTSSPINLVYTHHPAILYWTFCDNVIPQELQAQVVILWIEQNDTQSLSELYSVMEMNKESTLLILEVMAMCNIQISNLLQKALISVLQKYKDIWPNAYDHTWSILPSCLAKYISNPQSFSYESIANLIQFCCEYMPDKIDQTLVMRISCLLPGAFSKYCLLKYNGQGNDPLILSNQDTKTVINSLDLANCVLNKGNQTHDTRVAISLLGHEEFLTSVEFFLDVDNENITSTVMKLLTFLVQNQNQLNNRRIKIIKLEGMKILKFLQGGASLCVIVLEFLASYLEILSEKSELVMVQIPPPTALQLRALYLHIHMICAKADEMVASYCWCCLRRLLELSESMGLQEHLAMLPFTPALLLKTSETAASGEIGKFLSVWLKLLPTHFPRSHSIPASLKVIQCFSNQIDKSKLGKDFLETLRKTALLEKPMEVEKMDEEIQ